MWFTLSLLILTSYAVTFVLASSDIGFHLFRRPMENLIFLLPEKIERLFININPPEGLDAVYFPSCRMCVGFWVTVAVCLIYREPQLILPAYGGSYLLATQERQ